MTTDDKTRDLAAPRGGLSHAQVDTVGPNSHGTGAEDLGLEYPRERKLDRKERYAGRMAFAAFALFAVEVLIYIAAAFVVPDMTNINAVYQVIFPVTSTLVVAAGAYYHGNRQRA